MTINGPSGMIWGSFEKVLWLLRVRNCQWFVIRKGYICSNWVIVACDHGSQVFMNDGQRWFVPVAGENDQDGWIYPLYGVYVGIIRWQRRFVCRGWWMVGKLVLRSRCKPCNIMQQWTWSNSTIRVLVPGAGWLGCLASGVDWYWVQHIQHTLCCTTYTAYDLNKNNWNLITRTYCNIL